jgi:hypothetical protein
MKDLGVAKPIKGIRIIRVRANGTQQAFPNRICEESSCIFSMDGAKLVSTPLGSHFRLTKD